jgi:hypothetical protein
MKRISLLAVAFCLALTANASAVQLNPAPYTPPTYTSKFNSKPGFLTTHDARLQSLGCAKIGNLWHCLDASQWGPLPFAPEIPVEWRLRTEGCERESKTEVECKLRIELRELTAPVIYERAPAVRQAKGKAQKKIVCRVKNEVNLKGDMTLTSNYKLDATCQQLLDFFNGVVGGGIIIGSPAPNQGQVDVNADRVFANIAK